MAKRMFATLTVAAVLVVPTTGSQAQLNPIVVDGCAKLARVVYTEVASTAHYGPSRAGPWTIEIGQGDLEVCEHVTKTVTRAFTSAMRSAGVAVSWGAGRSRDDDSCRRVFISQCYPDQNRLGDSPGESDAGFVAKTWAVVSRAVMREMYNPHSSDEVRFRDSDLKLRLGLALRSVRTEVEY